MALRVIYAKLKKNIRKTWTVLSNLYIFYRLLEVNKYIRICKIIGVNEIRFATADLLVLLLLKRIVQGQIIPKKLTEVNYNVFELFQTHWKYDFNDQFTFLFIKSKPNDKEVQDFWETGCCADSENRIQPDNKLYLANRQLQTTPRIRIRVSFIERQLNFGSNIFKLSVILFTFNC